MVSNLEYTIFKKMTLKIVRWLKRPQNGCHVKEKKKRTAEKKRNDKSLIRVQKSKSRNSDLQAIV